MWFRDELELQVEELTAREPIEKRVGPFKYMDSEKISLSSSSSNSDSSLELAITKQSGKSFIRTRGNGKQGLIGSQENHFNHNLRSDSSLRQTKTSKWQQRRENFVFANEPQSQIQFTRAMGLTSQLTYEHEDDEEGQTGGLTWQRAQSNGGKPASIVPEEEDTLSNHSMTQLRRLKKGNADNDRRETSGFKNRVNGELELISLGLDDFKGKFSPQKLKMVRKSNKEYQTEQNTSQNDIMQTPLRSQPFRDERHNGLPNGEITPPRASNIRIVPEEGQHPSAAQTGRPYQERWPAMQNLNFYSAGFTSRKSGRLYLEDSAYRPTTKFETESTRSVPEQEHSDKSGLQAAPQLTLPRKRNSWALRREQSMEKHISEKQLQIERNLEKSEALLKHLEEKSAYLAEIEKRFALLDSESQREQQRLEQHFERVQQSKERHSKSIAELQLQIQSLKEQVEAKERLACETKRVLKDSLEKRAQLHHALLQTRGNLSPISGILLVRTTSATLGRTLKEEETFGFDKIFFCDQKQQDKGRLTADGAYLTRVEELFSSFLSPLIASCVFHKSRPLAILVAGQSAKLTVLGSKDSQTSGQSGLLHRLTTCLLDLQTLLPSKPNNSSNNSSQAQTEGISLSVLDVFDDELRDVLAEGQPTDNSRSVGWVRDRVVLKPAAARRPVRSLADVDVLLSLCADGVDERETKGGSVGAASCARVYRLVVGGEDESRVVISLVQIHSQVDDEPRGQRVWGSAQKKVSQELETILTPSKPSLTERKHSEIESTPQALKKVPFGYHAENAAKLHESENKINRALHTRNLDSKQVGEVIGIHPLYPSRPPSEFSAGKHKSPISTKQTQALSKVPAVLGRVIRIVKTTCEEVKGAASWPSQINAPFRETQLTRLLQDCLNGTGETALIITADCTSISTERHLQLVNTHAVSSLIEAFKTKVQPNQKAFNRAFC